MVLELIYSQYGGVEIRAKDLILSQTEKSVNYYSYVNDNNFVTMYVMFSRYL